MAKASKQTEKHPAADGAGDRRPWVDPEISEMDISRFTTGNPGTGPDASVFPDCTAS